MCSSFLSTAGPFWGLLPCSSSFSWFYSACIVSSSDRCPAHWAVLKQKVATWSIKPEMLVLPHFRALLQLCSVHCDKNLRRYISENSSLGRRNNVHLQFARPTLNAYCSTKCAFVNQIGLTGKLVKFWELYGSVAAPMSIDQPLVTATAIIVIITCFILFGNFYIHQTCKPQSQVDNKVTIVLNIIALAIKRCWMREINLTRKARTKLMPTSETKLNQVHLDQPLPT